MNRRLWFIGTGGGLALLAGLSAQGQQPSAPQYYQGRVSPPPPGLFPGQAKAPAAPPGTAAPPAFRPPANPPVTTAHKPRLTTPVMAGAEGVRQVGATEPAPPPFFARPQDQYPEPKPLVVPPAAPNDDVPPPTPAPPSFALPPVAADAVVPTTEVMTPPTAPVMTPTPPAMPVMTPAEVPVTATAAAPIGESLPSRSAPAVTVELLSPESVGVGQTLTYELVVKNAGPTAVTGVRVEEQLPAQATFVSSEPAAESTGGRLTFTLGTLEPAGERRIKIQVKPSDEGELTSRATVSTTSSVEARVMVTKPRVGVTVTGPEQARVGERVLLSIKLTNTGTGRAERVQLQAKFSDGIAHAAGPVIETELKELAAGQTRTFTLDVTAGKPGPQSCAIHAVADGTPAEVAKAQVAVVEPMLAAKLAGPGHCFVRSEPEYKIELSNAGTAATDAVQLWAQIPAGFELVQASDGGTFAEANRAVGWRLPGLPAGGARSITMKLRASSPSDGVVRVIAQMTPPEVTVTQAGAGQSLVPPLEARAELAVKSEGVPALRFEVADAEDPVQSTGEAVYEIRLMNQGTGPCGNVQLVAELADGTSVAGVTGATTAQATGQQVRFEPIAQFGVKQEAVYKVRVKASQAGDYRFRVRLSCDSVKTPIIKEENTRFY